MSTIPKARAKKTQPVHTCVFRPLKRSTVIAAPMTIVCDTVSPYYQHSRTTTYCRELIDVHIITITPRAGRHVGVEDEEEDDRGLRSVSPNPTQLEIAERTWTTPSNM